MMKRIVATLFFLAIALMVVALVAPGFIDWNKHKAQIVKRIQPYVARKIEVAGDVSFRILPNPQILLGDVTIENAKDAKAGAGTPFMKLKRLEASMKLEPLLQGRFEVSNINLVQPELNLEVMKGGEANWNGLFKVGDKGQAAGRDLSATADSVQLNQVAMTGGTLHYANDNTGLSWQLDNVNLGVAADTLFGPYRVSGTMQYKNYEVNVDMGTGRYDSGSPVPVHATFIPVEGLPQVKLNGVIDVKSGIDMQGDLEIQNGSLASLFDSSFLDGLDFMNDTADMTAALDFTGGVAKLTDIKAKFGHVKAGKPAGGEVTGSVSVQISHDADPVVTADLAGNYVHVNDKGGFMDAPPGFDARLSLSGKHVIWGGVDIPAVSIKADSDEKEWAVKLAQLDMPGHTTVKLAGEVTPKNNYAAYSMMLATDDLPRFIKSVAPAKGNILGALVDAPLAKKLTLNSSLDLKEDKISIFDIDARADAKMRISGVLNVTRNAKKPDFQAHLNFSKVDTASFAPEALHDALNALMNGKGALDITVSDFTDGGLKADSLAFKGATGPQGMSIAKLDAKLADGGTLHLDGKIADFHPAKGIDLNYALKTKDMADVLRVAGMDMPPLLGRAAEVDVKGTLKGEGDNMQLALSGKSDANDIKMEGVLHSQSGQPDTYEGSLHLSGAGGGDDWAALGLPVDRLIGRAGAYDFNGALSGSAQNFKIDAIEAKQGEDTVKGALSFESGKCQGTLAADTIDLDGWMGGDWPVKAPMDIELSGKKLVWRGNGVTGAKLGLRADGKGLKITDLKGMLWGGDLSATVSAEKQADGWRSVMSGKLENADLPRLAGLLGIDRGISASRGDIGFDVAAASAGKRKGFSDLSGKLTVSAAQLTVKDFSLSDLPALISAQATPPEFLSDMLRKSIRTHGDSLYKDVTAVLKVTDGKIDIEKMDIANADAALKVTGSYDPAPRRYKLKAETRLTQPPGMPAFDISRTGAIKSSADNIVTVKPIADYIAAHAPHEEPAAPETAKTPTAVESHEKGIEQPTPLKSSDATAPQDTQPAAGEGPGVTSSAPIEAEPLPAPSLPPETKTGDKALSTDEEKAAPPPKEEGGIKGILDRLDESP